MEQSVDKAGIAKKRIGRMHQWSSRYFILNGSKLSYKLKPESLSVRGSYELSHGCIVTDILEEYNLKAKKLYTFWIVWPHDKKKADDNKAEQSLLIDDNESVDLEEEHLNSKQKDLKHIVESEVKNQKLQRTMVEEQVEMHQAHDSNVSLGVKVAALAVGGAVIGALTAGIGLAPYMTIIGISAVAGGGAVAVQWRGRPQDSRVIMAFDTMNDAIEWKTCIEEQIYRLELVRKPMLPSTVDAKMIASILDKNSTSSSGGWKRVNICEGMRILEHNPPRYNNSYQQNNNSINYRCRKAQLTIPSSPLNTFLTIMNNKIWPKSGKIQVPFDNFF
jgi:hypothetical protein